MESYRSRVSAVKRELNIEYDFDEITLTDAEQQLLMDLDAYGDKFVFDKAWQSGDSEILCNSQCSFYDWISDEEELFEGKVE